MKFICTDNLSKREELIIGNTYELFKHESGPKFAWVKIIDESSSVGWRTIQCYVSDFKSVSDIRDSKLDQLLD
jgi:hypothetical protein